MLTASSRETELTKMHQIPSLWLESPFIHTSTACALWEAHHLLILEDQFSRKTFLSCPRLPQKMPACECSCLQPRTILQPKCGVLRGTDPMAILTQNCTGAAGNAQSRHCLQELQQLLAGYWGNFLTTKQLCLWTWVQCWDTNTLVNVTKLPRQHS